MSCYAGGTETFDIDLEAWHDIESFYDASTGKSPLMQLCRMVNLARTTFGVAAINFAWVSSNPADEDFAIIDYELNPSWNPLTHYDYVLNRCAIGIKELLNSSVIGTDCIARHFTNRVSLLSSLGSLSISLLGPLFKEDCLAKILKIREYLEAVDGEQLTLTAWTSVSYSIQLLPDGIYGTNGVPSAATYKSGGVELVNTVEHLYSGDYSLWAGVISPENDWPQTFLSTQEIPGLHVNKEFNFGFITQGIFQPDEFIWGCRAQISDDYSPISSWANEDLFGWCKNPESITKEYTVGLPGSTPSAVVSLLVGKIINYEFDFYEGSLVVDCSNPSGTLTFSSTGQLLAGESVEADFFVPDSSMPDNTPAFSVLPDCGDIPGGDYQATGLYASVRLNLTNNVFNFCIDACGNYHLEE